jgi:hypothetical protein
LKPNNYIYHQTEYQIIEHLKLKSITTEPVIVDPDFFYCKIDSTIQYDDSLTTESENSIVAKVTQNLLDLNLNWFNDFGKDLRYSKICSIIDETLENNAIVSNDTEIKMIYRWSPPVNYLTDLIISFDNALYYDGVRYLTPAGHENIIESSEFIYTLNDVDYTAFLRDNGLGTIGSDARKLNNFLYRNVPGVRTVNQIPDVNRQENFN